MQPWSSPPIRILLVEDDPDDVFLVTTAFRSCGREVDITVAQDGYAAQEQLRSCAASPLGGELLPDLILLDLLMPGMDGLEVLEWLKTEARLRDIPVFILSSVTEHHDVQEAYRLGANAYLPKEGDMATLEAIAAGIAGFATRQRQRQSVEQAEAGTSLATSNDIS